jgi:hypothetical protein
MPQHYGYREPEGVAAEAFVSSFIQSFQQEQQKKERQEIREFESEQKMKTLKARQKYEQERYETQLADRQAAAEKLREFQAEQQEERLGAQRRQFQQQAGAKRIGNLEVAYENAINVENEYRTLSKSNYDAQGNPIPKDIKEQYKKTADLWESRAKIYRDELRKLKGLRGEAEVTPSGAFEEAFEEEFAGEPRGARLPGAISDVLRAKSRVAQAPFQAISRGRTVEEATGESARDILQSLVGGRLKTKRRTLEEQLETLR